MNSALIEAKITEIHEGDEYCLIAEVEKVSLKPGERYETQTEILTVPVYAIGRIREYFEEHLLVGDELRIVGRLADGYKGLGLLAQHIEFQNRTITVEKRKAVKKEVENFQLKGEEIDG